MKHARDMTWNHWRKIDEKTVKLIGSGRFRVIDTGDDIRYKHIPYSPTIKRGDWVTFHIGLARGLCDIPNKCRNC